MSPAAEGRRQADLLQRVAEPVLDAGAALVILRRHLHGRLDAAIHRGFGEHRLQDARHRQPARAGYAAAGKQGRHLQRVAQDARHAAAENIQHAPAARYLALVGFGETPLGLARDGKGVFLDGPVSSDDAGEFRLLDRQLARLDQPFGLRLVRCCPQIRRALPGHGRQVRQVQPGRVRQLHAGGVENGAVAPFIGLDHRRRFGIGVVAEDLQVAGRAPQIGGLGFVGLGAVEIRREGRVFRLARLVDEHQQDSQTPFFSQPCQWPTW
jgi:hypothetical protein